MIANREFVRQQIFADRGSKFYTSAADNTLDALEDRKPVKFQLIEVTKYGCHIRALVDNKAYHLTKSSVRWTDVPHYFHRDLARWPRLVSRLLHRPGGVWFGGGLRDLF